MMRASLGLVLAFLSGPATAVASTPLPEEGLRARIVESYGKLPLRFERNEGQADRGASVAPADRARYLARGPGYAMFVTPTAMVLSLVDGAEPLPARHLARGAAGRPGRASVLRVELVKARADAEVEGLEELPGKTNYFVGPDARSWRSNVPGYAKVRSRGVYPGIDVVYYGNQKELEYDFVVAPGADPRRIRQRFRGARDLRLGADGSLVVSLPAGEVVQRAPRIYQETGSTRRVVSGRWAIRGKLEAGFELGAYDRKAALVIDPVLAYSVQLGGTDLDLGLEIAVDGSGSAYVTGFTESTDFPTQDPIQTDQPDADAFVTKLSPSGQSLVYSTYLGGNGFEASGGIAVDGSGNAYVTGFTESTDFPTVGSYQSDQPGPDVYVAKLSPAGDSLVYSTYLGGDDFEASGGIAIDASGSVYVSGFTASTDFPTLNPIQTDQPDGDAFVTKLAPSGSSLVYSTYLGGDGFDDGAGIAVDGSGSAYVTGGTDSTDFPTVGPYQADQPGNDAYVAKLSPTGDSLAYSTYLGGDGWDATWGIAVDGTGSAYVTGGTGSTDFPTLGHYQTDQPGGDAFVTKVSPAGDGLVYSTYLGGDDYDESLAIAVDGTGSATVTGYTDSTDFPTRHAIQTHQFPTDAFVTRLSPSGNSLVYSTYLGGSSDVDIGYGLTVDALGNAYVTGYTMSKDFPAQRPSPPDQPGPATNGFISKIVSGVLFTVAPCRLIDTRDAQGPYGGPPLAAGADRTFTVAGECGVSPTAQAVAVNIAVTSPSAAGNLRLYPADAALPTTSSLNYSPGQTRSNNAIVPLSDVGALKVRCAQASGTAHLILDVTGYFE
jgi:hypothetical protein